MILIVSAPDVESNIVTVTSFHVRVFFGVGGFWAHAKTAFTQVFTQNSETCLGPIGPSELPSRLPRSPESSRHASHRGTGVRRLDYRRSMFPLGDTSLLPVALLLWSSISVQHIAFERYLLWDFCCELKGIDEANNPNAWMEAGSCVDPDVSAAAARWLRWVTASRQTASCLSLLLLGAISDALRLRNAHSPYARLPVYLVQCGAFVLSIGINLLQMTLGWPRWVQIVGQFAAGLLGGEGNAFIAGLYALRGDCFEPATSPADRANGYLRLQLSFRVGSGTGDLIGSLLLSSSTLAALSRTTALGIGLGVLSGLQATRLLMTPDPGDWEHHRPPSPAAVTNPAEPGVGFSLDGMLERLRSLRTTFALRPRTSRILFALYAIINGVGQMDTVLIILLSTLGWSAAASARIEGVGRIAAAGYLLVAQALVRLLDAPRSLAVFSGVGTGGFVLLAYGSLVGNDALVGGGIAMHTATSLSLALTRAVVARVVPIEQAGSAFFALGLLDQAVTLASSFGMATLFAATAATLPSAVAWLCVPPTLATAVLGLQLHAAVADATDAPSVGVGVGDSRAEAARAAGAPGHARNEKGAAAQQHHLLHHQQAQALL